MHASAVRPDRLAPSASAASALTSLFVYECDRDRPGVAIPRPEVHLVVRFGPSARGGLDVYAFGGRERLHRKQLRGGQRAVTARLRLGVSDAVLGVSAAAMAARIVPLDELWGDAATRRLCARLADARDTVAAAAVLESAIAERLTGAQGRRDRVALALAAADRLTRENVHSVADALRVSERHLRRVFHEIIGMGPKAFTKLTRFHRALRAALADARPSWASIATSAGYYDQAHLIAEFRAIAGVTPPALLGELRAAPLLI
jgi:AraC-like DNA-binding protein